MAAEALAAHVDAADDVSGIGGADLVAGTGHAAPRGKAHGAQQGVVRGGFGGLLPDEQALGRQLGRGGGGRVGRPEDRRQCEAHGEELDRVDVALDARAAAQRRRPPGRAGEVPAEQLECVRVVEASAGEVAGDNAIGALRQLPQQAPGAGTQRRVDEGERPPVAVEAGTAPHRPRRLTIGEPAARETTEAVVDARRQPVDIGRDRDARGSGKERFHDRVVAVRTRPRIGGCAPLAQSHRQIGAADPSGAEQLSKACLAD